MGKWGSKGITVTLLLIIQLHATTLFGKDCFELASLNCKQIIALLPGPPQGLSLAEGDLVLAIQQTASDAERKAAEGENHFAFKSFYDAMGFKFDGDDYPQTKAFFKILSSNLGHSVKKIKKHFDRKRPVHFDNRITNTIVSPTDPSYPSGHATMGLFWATLLADLRPDLKAKLKSLKKSI
jgi:membrane-associated phospholipid phosphatase